MNIHDSSEAHPHDRQFANRLRPRYVTAKQAAQYLGLSIFSIYRLVERRAIPFIPLHPSGNMPTQPTRPAIRFDIEALDSWMRKQTVKATAEYIDERTKQ